MAVITVFHLDNGRPTAFGKAKKPRIFWTPKLNEDIREAERNRKIQMLVNAGQWPASMKPPRKFAGYHLKSTDDKLALRYDDPGYNAWRKRIQRKRKKDALVNR